MKYQVGLNIQSTKQRRNKRRISAIGSCFVLMPFKPDLDELYARCIKPTIEKTKVLQCLRADEIYGPRPIMVDIWKSIRQSKIVVADLTSRNPNVFYELGLTHAIQKPVILISQNIDDIPFDLKHIRVIIYMNTEEGRKELQNRLHKTLQVVIKEVEKESFVDQYAVLEAHEEMELTVDKNIEQLLHSLRSKDPNEILKVLSRIKDTYNVRERPKNCDPRILSEVISHLQSPFLEVQMATIQTIRAAGDQIHALYLHGFLSSNNPILAEESIKALRELQDHSVTPRLMSMFDEPAYQICRDDILQALGNIGGEEGIHFLGKIAADDGISPSERKLAISSLGSSYANEAIDVLLGLDVDGLDVILRYEFADALCKVVSPYHPVKVRKMETQLKKLLQDKSSEVRGSALAAYCLHSFKPFEGKLDRSLLWDQLKKENEEVFFDFFMILGLYQTAFTPEETGKLVELVKTYPTIKDDIVFILKDIGDKSVSDFMIRSYNESEEDDSNRLWVLDYLSRVPSKDAIELLHNEIMKSNDPSRISLAAIALSRLGIEDKIDLLLEKVFDTYPWVRHKVQDFFLEYLQNERTVKSKKAIKKTLKKLKKE